MALLSVRLFGGFHVTVNQRAIATFGNEKSQALLAFLAIERHAHERGALATLLWPGYTEATARANLRQALHQLRQGLGDQTGDAEQPDDLAAPPLLVTRQTLQINPAAYIQIDASEFVALTQACEAHAHTHITRCVECVARLEQAAALYQGEFLSDFGIADSAPFEEWRRTTQEWLHLKAVDALANVAAACELAGRHDRAHDYARRWLDLEPFSETALRQLMRALAFSGNGYAALTHYLSFKRKLMDELHAQPQDATTALHDAIRNGSFVAAAQTPAQAKRIEKPLASAPAPEPPLLGRMTDLAAIDDLFGQANCHWMTLTGPPGVGKTRLAKEVARLRRAQHPDGVFTVELASVSDPALVLPALVQALGIVADARTPPRDALLRRLGDASVLLLLDNFEHVAAAAPSIAALLPLCPEVKVLATSRAVLHVDGEHVLSVAPLAVPDPAATETQALMRNSAVELFRQRAQETNPDFRLTEDNVRQVARVCARLDGLPLAIELAAARSRLMSVPELLDRLGQLGRPLAVLRGSAQSTPARRQTLSEAIAWSYALLGERERRVFRALSVFVGGFTIEAAERVCNSSDGPLADANTLDGLETLLDNSLIHKSADGGRRLGDTPDDSPNARFGMLESIRAYAQDQLALDPAEARAARRRHAEYFLALAEHAEPQLHLNEQLRWLQKLQTEHNNLLAAIDWLSAEGDVTDELRLTSAMSYFWYARGYLSEGLRLVQRALARDHALPRSAHHGMALNAAGYFLHVLGRSDEACACFEHALAIGKDSADEAVAAFALQYLSVINPWHDDARAIASLEESLALYRKLRRPFYIANTLVRLGNILLTREDFARAQQCYEESVTLLRQTGDRLALPFAMRHLAYLLARRGDLAQAVELGAESARRNLLVDDHIGATAGLVVLAIVAKSRRLPLLAARLLGAVDAGVEAADTPLLMFDQLNRDQCQAALRAELDETAFAAAFAEGRALSPTEAIALGESGASMPPGSAESVESAESPASTAATAAAATPAQSPTAAAGDIREIPAISAVYGRDAERAQLRQWVCDNRARLVAILGMGGAGKTTLAAALAREWADARPGEFDCVIWRSLVNAPPVGDTLRACLQTLSRQHPGGEPASLDEQIHALLGHMRERRCLLVLDNMESLFLQTGRAGVLSPEHAGYGALLQQLGSSEHQSCVLITSREQPQAMARLLGDPDRVRLLRLSGIGVDAGRAILAAQGVHGAQADLAGLVAHYSGNPLALQLVAQTITDLFGGDVAHFQRNGAGIFGDIRDVLDEQFARLTDLERALLYWLAIERVPVTFDQLRENLVQHNAGTEILEALDNLKKRSWLERSEHRAAQAEYALQNVVMEFLTTQWVATAAAEIVSGRPRQLHTHALMKARAREHVRQAQVSLILQPVAERVRAGLQDETAGHMTRILSALRAAPRSGIHAGGSYAGGNLLNLALHLDLGARALDFSRLPLREAFLRDRAPAAIDLSGSDLSGAVFGDTFAACFNVAYNAASSVLAGATVNGEVRLWRADNGRPLAILKGHSKLLWALASNPRRAQLASGGEDGRVRLWDRQSGPEEHWGTRLIHHAAETVRVIAFHPSGEIVASAGDDPTVRLFNTRTGAPLAELRGHTREVTSLAFSPDGQWLASCADDRSIRVWAIAADAPPGAHHVLHESPAGGAVFWSVACAPDGRTLAAGTLDGQIWTWDLPGRQLKKIWTAHSGTVASIRFSADGALLASSSADATIRLWDTASLELVRQLRGHDKWVPAIDFHPTAQALASTSLDNTVRTWDIERGVADHVQHGHSIGFGTIVFGTDDSELIATTSDGQIRAWHLTGLTPDATPRARISRTITTDANLVASMAGDRDRAHLVTGGHDHAVRIWDLRRGELRHTLLDHEHIVFGVAVHPDGNSFASASIDQTARVWDMHSGLCLRTLSSEVQAGSVHNGVWSVAYSPDGATLATGHANGAITLWSLPEARARAVLRGHTAWVRGLAFSHDGGLLVSCANDHAICLWDAATGALRHTLNIHSEWVMDVALHPRAPIAASCSHDRTICLWRTDDPTAPPRVLRGHESGVYHVAFSPSGDFLASCGADGQLRLWRTSDGAPLLAIRPPGMYDGMNIAGASGLTPAQHSALIELGAREDHGTPVSTQTPTAPTAAPAQTQTQAPAQAKQNAPYLPADTTPFVGREAEVRAIRGLLQSDAARLVTLIGPGGAGKTRLALACARLLAASFADGAYFIALDALPADADAERVAAEAGRALGLELPDQDTLRHLAHALQNRRALLVLDNFEHLLTDDAPALQVVLRLLETSPHIQLLVTSRARLGIRPETLHPVEGLSTAAAADGGAARRSDAADFFVRCARRGRSTYAPTAKDLADIQTICELLQGMPLALEMAATQASARAIHDIAAELSGSLKSLSADWRDAPPRHRSMRAVFMWSWQLLDDGLRDALRRLAVFRGGFSADAAQAVAGATRADLARLADASLLVAARQFNDANRMDVHAMVADFAMEQLVAAQALDAAQANHADYFLDMARRADAALSGTSAEGDLEWTRRLQSDHENILLALEHLERVGRFDEALRLCWWVYPFWNTRGHYRDGEQMLSRIIESARAASLRDQRPPGAPQARASIALAHMYVDRGKNSAARPLLNDALVIATRLGETSIRARALLFLGVLNGRDGSTELAMSQLNESLEASHRLGERYSSALALNYIGALETANGQVERARANFQSCARLLENLGIECDRVYALRQCGHLALQAGDLADAAARYAQCVAISVKVVEHGVRGGYSGLASSIAAYAALLAERGDAANALLLCGAVRAIERLTAVEMWPADRARLERTYAALAQRLGQSAAATALAAGESLTVQQAVERCLALV